MTRRQRFALWVLTNIPVGDLAPYLMSYALTGRWNAGTRVN
jgi:hypothetical protein